MTFLKENKYLNLNSLRVLSLKKGINLLILLWEAESDSHNCTQKLVPFLGYNTLKHVKAFSVRQSSYVCFNQNVIEINIIWENPTTIFNQLGGGLVTSLEVTVLKHPKSNFRISLKRVILNYMEKWVQKEVIFRTWTL